MIKFMRFFIENIIVNSFGGKYEEIKGNSKNYKYYANNRNNSISFYMDYKFIF